MLSSIRKLLRLIEKTNASNSPTCSPAKKGSDSYDKLVIATGASARKPPVPGIELEGVTTLHSLSDADYLRQIRDKGEIKKDCRDRWWINWY